MYNPAFQTSIADARIGDLRRAGRTSRQHRSRRNGNPRPAARWAFVSHLAIRRLAFANPSRAN